MKTEIVTMNRLSQPAYAALAKITQGLMPVIPKTEGEAFFAGGVEFVLRKLREGYVVEAAE
jgi:hypothetical protein